MVIYVCIDHIARRRRDARAAAALGNRLNQIESTMTPSSSSSSSRDATRNSSTGAPAKMKAARTYDTNTIIPFDDGNSHSSSSNGSVGGHGAQANRVILSELPMAYPSLEFGGADPDPLLIQRDIAESRASGGGILSVHAAAGHGWHEHHTQPISESDYGW